MPQIRGTVKTEQTCGNCSAIIIRYPTTSGRVFCNIECKSEWQKTQRPVSVEWLRQKYEIEKLDSSQIALLVNRDSKSVWNWLKGSGIETRKRGTTGNHKLATPRKGWHHSEESKKRLSDIKKKSGSCPAMINGKHWLHVYKDRKPATWRGGISPERATVYSSLAWRKAARIVKRRDKNTCQRCGTKGKTDIHHITSFENKELRTTVSNLILLCEPCHYWVHSKKNTKREYIK
jgi:hypothetical protein